jgi:hypothetical protein
VGDKAIRAAAGEIRAASKALWEVLACKKAPASKWRALAAAGWRVWEAASAEATAAIGREGTQDFLEKYNLGLLKCFNDAVGFAKLLPPSLPMNPAWGKRSLIEVFVACGVGAPCVLEKLALEWPVDGEVESVMVWLYNAVAGATPSDSPEDGDQVLEVISFLVRIGAAERTHAGLGGLSVCQRLLHNYKKTEKYHQVLRGVVSALREPDGALDTAGALVDWHEHVSTVLCRCMHSIDVGRAKEISRRMCFVKFPDLSKVTGWENVLMDTHRSIPREMPPGAEVPTRPHMQRHCGRRDCRFAFPFEYVVAAD